MNISDAQKRIKKTEEHFLSEVAKIRGSRANPQLLEDIIVEVYGSQMPIKQLGTINVSDPTLLTIQCWDNRNVEAIRKAIEDSDLNVTASADGTLIRIVLPSLTEERREELIKIVKNISEEARIVARKVRREFLDSLEAEGVSEDDLDRGKKEMQEIIDEFNKTIDEEFEKKSEELMNV